MKKIVFSSVCAVALSSSAFAADLTFTGEGAKEWYEQVISSGNNVDLGTLGWTAGKNAIGATIGGADASDKTTIVGSFVMATGATQCENTYVKSGDDALKVAVKDLTTSNKVKVNATTMIQDYQKVEAQLKLASAAADIYSALSEDNKKVTGLDGTSNKYTLDDKKDNIDAIAKVLISLGTDEASLKENDKFALAKVQTALDGMFGSSKTLNDYASAMADAGADKTKLEAMKTAIKSDINSLVNAIEEAEDKALAKHIQAQLNDALVMFDRYTKADKQLNELDTKVIEAEDVVTGKFAGATGYTNVATKDNDGASDVLTSKDEIKKNIIKTAGTNMNTSADGVTIDASYALNADKLSIDQAIAWVEAKGETSVVGTGGYDNNAKLLDALKEIKSAIEEGREIDTAKAEYAKIKVAFKKADAGSDGDSIALTEEMITQYNGAVKALEGVKDEELKAIITANGEFDKLLAKLASNSITGELKTKEVNQALGAYKGSAKAQALVRLFVDDNGRARTEASVAAKAEVDFASLSAEDKEKLGKTEDEQKANYKKQEVAKFKAQIQTAANEVAKEIVESNKQSISAEALSTLNIQINNMNKRMGELRGLDGEAGAWIRTWGGKISGDDIDSFNYYSTQIGADKKSNLKDGDLYIGALIGMDKVDSEVKSTSYSAGLYASFISNSGFFADGIAKFISTSHDRSGYDIENQMSFLASFEGGYRFNATESFYVEPSLEFITGHIGEYSSKQASVTTKVDSFSPVVFKPQVFVGGEMDSFTYRAGVGGVLNANEQTASVRVADIVEGVNAAGETKLDKNNHGFVSLGGSYKINNNLRLNLGLERSFGGKLTNDYEVNATVRYGF